MPYGVSKDIGGDSKQNDKFMERCVSAISGTNKRTGKPYTKGEKIAICKSQLSKNKAKAGFDFEQGDASADEDTKDHVGMSMAQCVRKMMESGRAKDSNEATAMCESMLAKSNFDVSQLELVLNRELL